MAHLSSFMEERGLTDEDVASEVGVSRPTISRIRRGLQRPDWDTLAKFKKWSGGRITADDFVEART